MTRKTFLPLVLTGLLTLGLAQAVPVRLGTLPLSIEPNATLLTLSDAGLRSAFPNEAGRPDAVFFTADRKVSVAFEWRSSTLAAAEVEGLITQFPSVIRAQVPNVRSLKAAMTQMGGSPWAQFVFTTPGKGDEMRREMLVTSLQGRMLVVTIAGNTKDYSRNEAVIRNLVGSVKLN